MVMLARKEEPTPKALGEGITIQQIVNIESLGQGVGNRSRVSGNVKAF